MRRDGLTHEFVESIPATLEEGRLYISIRFRTASHLCACGCGTKVVTPIKPAKWHLTYDGETVSLWPSVGRWQLPCRSHYWIRHDRVEWAADWSDKQVERGRQRDARDVHDYYRQRTPDSTAPDGAGENESAPPRFWSKIIRWRR